MSLFAYDLAAVGLLWRREIVRLWRQPGRPATVLGASLITWLMLSAGARLPPAEATGAAVGPFATFFPGAILLTMVLAASLAAAGLLDDRRNGWLAFVGSTPASPAALVAGQCAGVATAVWLQVGLLVALAPLAGYGFETIAVPMLIAVCALGSVACAGLAVCVVWVAGSPRAFRTSVALLFGLIWLGSGALFGSSPGAARAAMATNPGASIVSALRHALVGPGGSQVPEAMLSGAPWVEVAGVAGFAAVGLVAALVAATLLAVARRSPVAILR